MWSLRLGVRAAWAGPLVGPSPGPQGHPPIVGRCVDVRAQAAVAEVAVAGGCLSLHQLRPAGDVRPGVQTPRRAARVNRRQARWRGWAVLLAAVARRRGP